MGNYRRHALIWSICLLTFIDSIGSGLVFPLLPTLFLDQQHGLILDASATYRNLLYGISFALFPLAGIFGMPILGGISDVSGRRKTLIFSVIIVVISYCLSLLAVLYHLVWCFLIARLFLGFSSGGYSVANAALVDISKNDTDKINNFKYLTLASILGFVLGPGFSFFMPKTHNNALSIPFTIALVLAIVNLILLFCLFPQSKAVKKVKIPSLGFSLHIQDSILFITKYTYLRSILISYFLFQIGFGLVLQLIPLHLSVECHFLPHQIGLFFIIMASVTGFSMFILHPRLAIYYTDQQQLKFALMFITLILLCLALLTYFANYFPHLGLKFMWIIYACFYMSTPFFTLNITKVFSNLVANDEQGKLMGGLGLLAALGLVLSALLVGVLVGKYTEVLQFLTAAVFGLSWLFLCLKTGKVHI